VPRVLASPATRGRTLFLFRTRPGPEDARVWTIVIVSGHATIAGVCSPVRKLLCLLPWVILGLHRFA
jgi:hypothetical protein